MREIWATVAAAAIKIANNFVLGCAIEAMGACLIIFRNWGKGVGWQPPRWGSKSRSKP